MDKPNEERAPAQSQEELIANGFREEDAEIAWHLIRFISGVDKKVFPGNPLPIGLAPDKHPHGIVVQFVSKDGVSESYEVILVDLVEWVEHEASTVVRFMPKEGKYVFLGKDSERPQVEFDLILLATACHEVRHRLQLDEGIPLFTPAHADSVEDDLLRGLIEYSEILFIESEKISVRDGKPEGYIQERASPREFDAHVVGEYILHRMFWDRISDEEILELIRMRPPM